MLGVVSVNLYTLSGSDVWNTQPRCRWKSLKFNPALIRERRTACVSKIVMGASRGNGESCVDRHGQPTLPFSGFCKFGRSMNPNYTPKSVAGVRSNALPEYFGQE